MSKERDGFDTFSMLYRWTGIGNRQGAWIGIYRTSVPYQHEDECDTRVGEGSCPTQVHRKA